MVDRLLKLALLWLKWYNPNYESINKVMAVHNQFLSKIFFLITVRCEDTY